ncbi:MAG TPA: hypothetical protein DDZ81_27255 [Acetobacteraceae bacterium]|nr:hypothetical protein [Acetobacteraceae bacterium]
MPRQSVHRIPLPTFVTTAKRPSYRGGTAWSSKDVSSRQRSEIFLQRPLDIEIAERARRANHPGSREPHGSSVMVFARSV